MVVKLRKYQRNALIKWKELGYRAALYWEPGLGKSYVTMQSIIRLLDTNQAKRALVVVPAGLVTMWEEDIIKSGLNPEDLFIYKPKKSKSPIELPKDKHKVILISYSLIYRREIPIEFDICVCDESHNIKSHRSKAYKTLSKLIPHDSKLLLLSGTPFPNGRVEVFSQLNLIKPGLMGKNITQFRNKFCRCTSTDYYTYEVRSDQKKNIDILLHKYCDFRKTKDEVELPDVNYINVGYELTPKQRKTFNQIKNTRVYKSKEGDEIPIPLPAIRLLMLRQVSSGFLDIHLDYTKELGEEYDVRDNIDDNIDKEQTLFDILNGLPKNKQAIIWFTFKKTGRRLKKMLEDNFKVALVYGDTPKKERKEILKKYTEGKIQFVIANPLTLGTGINEFSQTQYMIWYELSYDSAVYEQAEGRINRIGQTNKMFIYTLIGKNTMDEKVQFALQNKLDVEKYIFDTYLDKT